MASDIQPKKKNKHVSTICFGLPWTNIPKPLLWISRVISEVGNVTNQVLMFILNLGNSGVKVPAFQSESYYSHQVTKYTINKRTNSK